MNEIAAERGAINVPRSSLPFSNFIVDPWVVRPVEPDPLKRFWDKVEYTDGCWFWRGSKSQKGYGSYGYDGKMRQAHRLAYRFTFGPFPDELHVCHDCDNPGCVRPDHLFLGTHDDNMADKAAKGRAAAKKGSANITAKLTEAQVIEVRTRVASGETQRSLATTYGVCRTTIGQVVRRQTWRHV